MKVISIKSSIGKMKMIYREFTDMTVTTCTPVMLFLVPTVCAGNKVRNTIAINGYGIGMVPVPFLQKLSDRGYQDARCCPVYGDCPRWSGSEEMQEIFRFFIPKHCHTAKNCPLYGEGQSQDGCFQIFLKIIRKNGYQQAKICPLLGEALAEPPAETICKKLLDFFRKRLSHCEKLSFDGWRSKRTEVARMVRIQHQNYTWCRFCAGIGAGRVMLQRLQIKDCRANGVVGAGLHNSLYYIFIYPYYLSVFYFPFSIQIICTNYTEVPEMQGNQGLAGHENYTLCYTATTFAAQRCRSPPCEVASHINTKRRT